MGESTLFDLSLYSGAMLEKLDNGVIFEKDQFLEEEEMVITLVDESLFSGSVKGPRGVG